MSFKKLRDTLGGLPVARIANDVTLSVIDGVVTTLSSDTGSGKTLYQTSHLADTLGEVVVVLVPRRFLAVNAAETIAELSGCEIGKEVGYAVGSQAGDRSKWGPDTRLLFVTNGYALASGLVQKAKMLVLDEVHETSLDLSIIRALLHLRLSRGESLKVLEMSATMDAKQQAAYWGSVAKTKVFETDGRTFDCDVRHRPAGRVENEVINLLEEGKRGILVFRPGVGEVEETAEAVQKLATAVGIKVEVSQIYGEMDYATRKKATESPDGISKVLVGTNVVESGANIPWLDAGVSCGTGKENSVRPGTGATYLQLVDLPRWRLQQQEGRVKRFRRGVYVLCAPKSHSERAQASRPEIERLALTELVMHCAGFGLRAHELQFDYSPDSAKVEEAELKLQRLGLIDEACMLTEAGKWITGMPVGPETGAMLWHAKQIDCLSTMLPLAAVIEVGGVRKEFRSGHGLDSMSDHIDGLLAFKKAFMAPGKERRSVLEDNNIGYKRFEAASDFLRDLERRMEVQSNLNLPSLDKLSRCILAGSLDKLFMVERGRRGNSVVPIKLRYGMGYNVGQGSAVYHLPLDGLVTGDLRVITPKDRLKSPFTVVEKVSVHTLDDLYAVARVRPGILIEEEKAGSVAGYKYRVTTLFGKYEIKHVLTDEPPPLDFEDGWGIDSRLGSSRGTSLASIMRQGMRRI